MVRIDALIFGYRRIEVKPEALSLLTSIFIRASIPSTINNDGCIIVRERDFAKIKNLLSGRIEFTYSEPLGLCGRLKIIKYKGALISSLIISIALVILLSRLVWDIRVEGNEALTDSQVVLGLSECGFELGDFWCAKSLSEIESAFLDSCEEASWININRRGCVAYVKILEREENGDTVEESSKPCNIVAAADCVIEEITVKRGIAIVKAGDTVRKGDILVIGAYPEEMGGGFCRAEASVVGRINDSVCVEISREYEKKTAESRKAHSITLNIFKFSLNIFKRYRNLTNECAIIEDEIKCSLFNTRRLPLSIERVFVIEYGIERREYTDAELVKIASDRLTSLRLSRLSGADLLKINTEGHFTDSGYILTSDMVFLSEVGVEVDIDIVK